MINDQNERSEEAKARADLQLAVKSAASSLDFAPPEMRDLHLYRLAERCCQIGIDMARALSVAEGAR